MQDENHSPESIPRSGASKGERVRTGLAELPDLPWGSHICQLYRDRNDLVGTLVEFFAAGLRGEECCLWIVADPLPADQARAELRSRVPDLDHRERRGQIEILPHSEWSRRLPDRRADDILEAWLEREAEALRNGWQGLRISGNTSFVAPAEWESFAAYEERVHRAFQGRRIVALCSYSLDGCDAEKILGAMQTHGTALVRHGNSWEPVRSVTQVLSRDRAQSPASEHAASDHSVQFHDSEYGAAGIAAHLAEGLSGRSAAVMIATPDHRRAIERALGARSLDTEEAVRQGRLIELDAEETLARISAGGTPREDLLIRHVGSLISRLAERCDVVYAYGEMVDLLAGEGRMEDAIALEEHWNALLEEHPVRLLCGYHLSAFELDGSAASFRRICDLHDDVRPLEPPRAPSFSHERLLAELRQRSRVARRAADQLSRLQSVTACLSELTSTSGIARAVGRDVRRAVSADAALLAIPNGDGESISMPEPDTPSDEELQRSALLALRSGEPSWRPVVAPAEQSERRYRSVACLPVITPGRQLGVLAFGWRRERVIRPAERALLHEVAAQVAVALDRARLYEDARAAREKAELASRAKDEFLAMLGHELRNPLGPIVTTLDLMRMRAGESLEQERAVIERQVDHLLRLVEDLLDVSRITRGKIELRRMRVEVSQIVARALENVGPLIEQRRQRLIVDVPPTGLVVDGDVGRLTQVVANLLSNAAKFTPSIGTVQVSAAACGDEVVLRVVDDGVGIAPELLPTVFDSFVQGPVSRARSEGGLGLGLAIVRSLVELHGGAVSAASGGRGCGAELVVRLPLAARLQEPPAASSARLVAPQARGLHVLVVDDNVDAASSLGELLDTMGCETSLAHDGPSALAAAQRHEPSLVLLDIGLPVMDGYEVAARLRDLEGVEDARIVAVTGYGQPGDRDRSRAAGFDDHLVKPLSPDHLRSLIAEVAREVGLDSAAL